MVRYHLHTGRVPSRRFWPIAIHHHLACFQLITGYYISVDLRPCAGACLKVYHSLLGWVVYYISAVKFTTAIALVNGKSHYSLLRNDAVVSFIQPTIFQSIKWCSFPLSLQTKKHIFLYGKFTPHKPLLLRGQSGFSHFLTPWWLKSPYSWLGGRVPSIKSMQSSLVNKKQLL